MTRGQAEKRSSDLLVTGTFLSEIAIDIPHNNWGAKEWAADFKVMESIGIDTVIFNSPAFKERVCFDSKTLKKHLGTIRPTHIDYLDLFFELAEKHNMSLFLGTYNGNHWQTGDIKKEFAINKDFCTEMVDLYGDRSAFKGWYIPYEMCSYWEVLMELHDKLASHLRSLRNYPILTSPFMEKNSGSDRETTLSEYEFLWDRIWNRLKDNVDIVAFQDGHVPFLELHDYMEINVRLAEKHGLQSWSNLESFGRGSNMGFWPLCWDDMKYKIDVATKCDVDKIITWEFSHFMSPNACFPQAHGLFNKYCDHYDLNMER